MNVIAMSVPLGVQEELFLFCAWLLAINNVLLEKLCVSVCDVNICV